MVGIKSNVFASLASQLYAAVVAIIMLPVYVRYMGAEAFGLVGFFTMSQAVFQLLDLGLSPMVTRYVARYRGGAVSRQDLSYVLRTIIILSCAVALAGAIATVALSPILADRWLRSIHLEAKEITLCISLMAPAIALRFVSSLVRSAISGFEALVMLGWLTALATTLRFICVLPVLWYWGAAPSNFFAYQLAVAIVELLVLALALIRLFPERQDGAVAGGRNPLVHELRFALTASFTGTMWILATQLDKVLLSSILPLDQYGYYTLCATVANGVLLLSSPVGAAILPRLIKLQAEERFEELSVLYQRGTQLAVVITTPAVVLLTVFAPKFLWIWTADEGLARVVWLVLLLYSAGTAFLVAGSFQYLLQISHGNLRLHMTGNLLFVGVLVPAVFWSASAFGMIGAASVWLVCNVLMLLVWTPIVHARYLPSSHWRWLGGNVIRIWIPTIAVGLVLRYALEWPTSRLLATAELVVIAGVLLAVSILSSREGLKLVRQFLSPG